VPLANRRHWLYRWRLRKILRWYCRGIFVELQRGTIDEIWTYWRSYPSRKTSLEFADWGIRPCNSNEKWQIPLYAPSWIHTWSNRTGGEPRKKWMDNVREDCTAKLFKKLLNKDRTSRRNIVEKTGCRGARTSFFIVAGALLSQVNLLAYFWSAIVDVRHNFLTGNSWPITEHVTCTCIFDLQQAIPRDRPKGYQSINKSINQKYCNCKVTVRCKITRERWSEEITFRFQPFLGS